MQRIIDCAKELLSNGNVARVLGWKNGDLAYNPEPTYFNSVDNLNMFVYNGFCGANLSKYMIEASKLDGKTLVFLKPCDTYSFNQLIKEHRVNREKAYIVGVDCSGNYSVEKIKEAGIKGIESIEIVGDSLKVQTIYGQKTMAIKDALMERCTVCKGKDHKIFDEVIAVDNITSQASTTSHAYTASQADAANQANNEKEAVANRFDMVEKLEAMTPEERFIFWQGELSKCIRCNACRNACPACSCKKCVFDSNNFDSAQKSNVGSFEEKMFHIIRAFHVTGRCTDCGECSRVCPQGIPLHLLNRKFIKDINEFYGEFQAGEDAVRKGPLNSFTLDDVEPSIVGERR